ncbi:bud emergence protein 1 [Cryptotrichosporon argae]
MKSLRRSLNDKGGPQSPPLAGAVASPLGRPAERVAPPSKVIRALVSHRSTNPQQLSYTKGDFWYVTGEREGWYEALNPLTGSRGLVPKDDFEEFNKGGQQTQSRSASAQAFHPDMPAASSSRVPTSQSISPPPAPGSGSSTPDQARKHSSPLYAIVQYDFHAERPDELEAKAGEPIVVIAQSNHEWFVAKPIGRLGGPGLIPVAFVEIRDPVTGKPLNISISSVPQVEEWKKATADYKAAAIPLGRFDIPPDQVVQNSPYAPGVPATGSSAGLRTSASAGTNGLSATSASHSQTSLARTQSSASVANGQSNGGGGAPLPTRSQSSALSAPLYRPEQDDFLPPGALAALAVPSFHNESGNYWFRLHASFVPDDARAPAYTLTLYRTYEDFYDFQITLLDTFPAEAGRTQPGDRPSASPPARILPYMPGPVDDPVDDELTEYRREELDAYVKALLELRGQGADYILRHELIRSFFAAKYGDYCEDVARADVLGDLQERMADVHLDGAGAGANGGSAPPSAYADPYSSASQSRAQSRAAHTRAPSAASRHSRGSGVTSPPPVAHVGAHAPAGSSRGPSPLPPIDTRRESATGGSGAGYAHQPAGSYSRGGSAAGHYVSPGAGAGGPYGVQSPYASSHGHSHTHSQSTSHGHAHTPSAGAGTGTGASAVAGGGQPPYIKIKIYDRATDDLIAIRVHPHVSHAELLDKVRGRLGAGVHALRCRTGMGGYGDVADDRALADWLRTEDQKLVLYAEQ